jgi:hypothetical protein
MSDLPEQGIVTVLNFIFEVVFRAHGLSNPSA